MRSSFVVVTRFVALGLLASACVEQPQADPVPLPYWVVDKDLFDPTQEWWSQRTIIDAPLDVGFTLIGDGDLGQTIRWRIEEAYLVAERSRSFVRPVLEVVENEESELIAAYPIVSHFDVVGGQIVFPQKKTWRDLPYMRVDWSSNYVDTVNFPGAKIDPDVPAVWIDDPKDPNHPIFANDYIDFTTREYVSPSRATHPLTGEDANCDASELFVFRDCTPMELLIRSAYRRIPRDHDYEPFRASDADRPPQFSAHNVFTNSFVVTDPEYLVTDDSLVENFNRHNLWKRSYADDGAPIPYRERALREIPYHLSGPWPVDMIGPAEQAIAQWDAVLRETVRDLRAYECVDDGGALAACRAEHEVSRPILLLCKNNPVKAGDPKACGSAGTVARLGDMRFRNIEWLAGGGYNQPMGFTWWSTDFTSGELTNVHITLSDQILSRNVSNTVDAILLARVGVSPEEIGFDEDTSSWFASTLRPAPLVTAPARNAPRRDRLPGNFDWADALAPLVDSPVARHLEDPEDFPANGVLPDQLAPEEISPIVQPYRKVRDVVMKRQMTEGQHAIDMEIPATLDIATLARDYAGLTREEITAAVKVELASWSILHELGHSLGLRHNFASSFDALNYHPDYWAARRDDCASRPDCGYTQAEMDADIEAYSYSSVMDYLNRARASVGGLGPTDIAVVKALYGKLAPVFTDASLADSPEAVGLVQGTLRMGALANPIHVTADATATTGYRARSFHYSEYPDVLGDLSARDFVPGRYLEDGPDSFAARDGRLVVPRLACEDREVGSFAYCSQFDQGADAAEVVKSAADWYQYFAPINYFRRGRAGWSGTTISATVSARTFFAMRRWHTQLQQTLEDLRPVDADFTEPGLAPLTRAAEMSVRFLTRVMTMPAAGPHVSSAVRFGEDAFVPLPVPASDIGLPARDGDIVIAPGLGLPVRSRLIPTLQAFAADNVGALTDKELALEVLLAPDDWTFQGVTTQGAYATWRTNFYLSYPDELTAFLGALIAGDSPQIAPRISVGDRLTPQDPFAVAPSGIGQMVDPALPFVMRARALAFYVSLESSGYLDQRLLNSIRVLRIGTIDATVPPVAGSVDFEDPIGGFQYRADSYPYGPSGSELGIGARILTRATELGTAWEAATPGTPEEEELRALLEEQMLLVQVVRGIVDSYDNIFELPDDPPPLDEEEEEAP